MSIEKTIQQINKIFKNIDLKAISENKYNRIMLISKNTEKPIIRIYKDGVNEDQYIIEKLTELKPFLKSINSFIDDISYGHINFDYNRFKFIYKNTILVEIKNINKNLMTIESNFKIKKGTIHIPYGEGKLIVSTGFNSTEDITYRIEKQVTLKEFNTNILNEMNEQTINVFKNNLNINVAEYPQVEYTIWGLKY